MNETKRVCLGVPTVFSFSSKTCSTCADFGVCRRAAHNELKANADDSRFRVALLEHERHSAQSDPLPHVAATALVQGRASRAKHQRFALSEQQQKTVASLPRKVGRLVAKLFERGTDAEIRIALRGHAVIALESQRSLSVALNHLQDGYDRAGLRTYFMDEMGWTYGSAFNEVSLLWRALPAIGVAVEKQCRLVVDPSLTTHNN